MTLRAFIEKNRADRRKTIGVGVALLLIAVVGLTAQDCTITTPSCPQLLPIFSSEAAAADSLTIGCPYRYVDENGDTTTVGGVDLGT